MSGTISLEIFVVVNKKKIGLTDEIEREKMSQETIVTLVKNYLADENILKDDFYLVDYRNIKINDKYIKNFLKKNKDFLAMHLIENKNKE